MKLSSYVFKKGKFIVPFHTIPNLKEMSNEESWTYGRLPEYIWIGLILKYYGRNRGLHKLRGIIMKLHELAPEIRCPRISEIITLHPNIQLEWYNYIIAVTSKAALAPLTLVLTVSKAPLFSSCFYSTELSIEERCNVLTETMRDLMDHQSYESTDIRFIVLYSNVLSGKTHLLQEQTELLNAYPYLSHDNERMRKARPTVRATEMMLLQFEKINVEYIKDFWRCVSEMTECSIYSVRFHEEDRNINTYMECLYEVFNYLSELFVSTSPLDNKMSVLLGISTYSYKRFLEAYEHKLFNAISGRSCIRVLIENYIMIKYLLKNEAAHENIWKDFQLYGLGQYKLILERYREGDAPAETHFDEIYVEALVNELGAEEFLDIDTRYFDQQNIRIKADNVGEKSLYGLYYDYDSAFEHGLWGAIRESSMLKCNNPAHQYHCVPDITNQNRLKSVLPDCIRVMNKILIVLNEVYGIPDQLFRTVIDFDIQPFTE